MKGSHEHVSNAADVTDLSRVAPAFPTSEESAERSDERSDVLAASRSEPDSALVPIETGAEVVLVDAIEADGNAEDTFPSDKKGALDDVATSSVFSAEAEDDADDDAADDVFGEVVDAEEDEAPRDAREAPRDAEDGSQNSQTDAALASPRDAETGAASSTVVFGEVVDGDGGDGASTSGEENASSADADVSVSAEAFAGAFGDTREEASVNDADIMTTPNDDEASEAETEAEIEAGDEASDATERHEEDTKGFGSVEETSLRGSSSSTNAVASERAFPNTPPPPPRPDGRAGHDRPREPRSVGRVPEPREVRRVVEEDGEARGESRRAARRGNAPMTTRTRLFFSREYTVFSCFARPSWIAYRSLITFSPMRDERSKPASAPNAVPHTLERARSRGRVGHVRAAGHDADRVGDPRRPVRDQDARRTQGRQRPPARKPAIASEANVRGRREARRERLASARARGQGGEGRRARGRGDRPLLPEARHALGGRAGGARLRRPRRVPGAQRGDARGERRALSSRRAALNAALARARSGAGTAPGSGRAVCSTRTRRRKPRRWLSREGRVFVRSTTPITRW